MAGAALLVAVGSGASPTPAHQAGRPPLPTPAIPMDALPQQASLYEAIVKEFVRLGWNTVCVEVMPGSASAAAVDPPDDIIRDLARRNRSFRPRSACLQDGEDVIDRRSGNRDAVAVTVVGADREQGDILVRVQWCCWVGWGTFRFTRRGGIWSLKQTEGWLQT